MKNRRFDLLALGLLATPVLALAVSAGAQTPAPSAPPEAGKSSAGAPMAGHHGHKGAGAANHSDMKKQCESMMKHGDEMQAKMQAMDASLDKLVEEMNAAKNSKAPDAMEKPMAAVINELVVQRKAARTMMMEMQPQMMKHMMHHMGMQGSKGAMECPMMKMDKSSEHGK